MLFNRQRCLLALVDACGGDVGNLDFQKLLFLHCHEAEDTPTYEFVPYKYGGFSFTSYADKRRLIERGLLVAAERQWTLTPAGRAEAVIAPSERMRMHRHVLKYANVRGDALVATAYRRHPYYAIRSEIAAHVLNGDAAALNAIESARPVVGPPGLCTIGYEGRTLEGYLNCLIRDGVSLLCDVRRNPLSRKYGFSKGTLSKACDGVGIRYEHLPALGIASEERRSLETQADYDALFATYEQTTLPRQGAALATIRAWIDAGARVALTCYEANPKQCHRHCVAEALVAGGAQAIGLRHL
jgi:hypothetical protein